jgi:DNA polymerase-1
MSAAEALQAARAAGIRIEIDGSDLVLEAPDEPPRAVIDALSRHKADIIALLRPTQDGQTTSLDLLRQLGAEVVLIESEATATQEISALLAETAVIGLDIETAPRRAYRAEPEAALDPLKSEVRLLQIATESRALVIDLRKVPPSSPSLAPVWGQTLVGHNLSFDAKLLMANGVDLNAATIIDSILLSGLFLRGEHDRTREGSRRPSLAIAVKEALGVELPKQMQQSEWGLDELTSGQVAYAALDAVMARCLFTRFQTSLHQQRCAPDGVTLAARLNKAVTPIARMELAGVMLDTEALARLDAGWRFEAARLREEIKTRFGVENPKSAKQVEAWLCKELHRLGKGREWPRTPAGKLSTQAKHLKRLIGELPGIEAFVKLSRVQQLASNFGQKLLDRVGNDGRLHANFQIAGAKSGRFTSSKPNLQNIPTAHDVRSAFIAAPGYSLVCADYSQLELRVMAAISGDELMTKAYREGRDLHAITAAAMLGISAEEFDTANPAHADARKKAKAINFGIIFGSGANGLREFARDAYEILLAVEEASDLIRRFLTTYGGVAAWMRQQEARTRRDGFIETVGGRRDWFAWEAGGAYSRNLGFNLPIQGTAAEIAIEAVIRIDAHLRRDVPAGKLVLQVHDEFVLEVPHGSENLAKRILVEEMTAAFSALLPNAPVTYLVDAHAGPNWAAAKGG